MVARIMIGILVDNSGENLGRRTILITLIGILAASVVRGQEVGRFVGQLVLRPLEKDGRLMELVQPFGFIDGKGREWLVPSGAKTDGASIPSVLWFYYAPFTGHHRLAAAIHDYYCEVKNRTWRDTHRAFYDAMKAAGVGELDAKIMYGAVYHFGPRWGIGTASRGPGATGAATPEQERAEFERVKTWIEKNNPKIHELEDKLDES